MKPRLYHYDLPSICDPLSSEIQVQKSCRSMIAKCFKATGCFAVPNGQKRTRWQAKRAKAEGLTKGAVDLVVYGEPGLVAFCEIKKRDGHTEAEQHDHLEQLVAMGHFAGVFRSQETLRAKLIEWGFK